MQKLQCTCCGGKLVMREDGVAACQFCGMEYAPETVRKMIVEMRGSVQVEGVDTADSIAKRAEIFMSMNDVANAAANFRKLTQLYPDDYRGWWGLTRLVGLGYVFPGECWKGIEDAAALPESVSVCP